jgi:4-hydroxybenzoyl-CoA reductase subunit beta
MMRLPPFRYVAPSTIEEAANVLSAEGTSARLVAGGTDLWPNMKRRQDKPLTIVAVARIPALQGATWAEDGSLTMGAATTLRALERDPRLAGDLPALDTAVRSISTPLLRNMGTIGGNVCLDTRCNYLDQTWEWRRTVDFCMKCEGEICWTAPGSDRCWAVCSSDSVPVLVALGARIELVSTAGAREIPIAELFRDDGIDWLTKRPDEVITRITVPAQGSARSAYRKVRRRGAFDFPVAGVAVRLEMKKDVVEDARIVLNGVGSAPFVCEQAAETLRGKTLADEVIAEASRLATKPAKALDNTDHEHAWRRKMIAVETRRALESLRAG